REHAVRIGVIAERGRKGGAQTRARDINCRVERVAAAAHGKATIAAPHQLDHGLAYANDLGVVHSGLPCRRFPTFSSTARRPWQIRTPRARLLARGKVQFHSVVNDSVKKSAATNGGRAGLISQ